MNTLPQDTELDTELQELYILCKHWLQDISFMQDELHFLKNIEDKLQVRALQREPCAKNTGFADRVRKQEQQLLILKNKVPAFLNFLGPFINNLKKRMDLAFLEKYNTLEDELQELACAIKKTKEELFLYTGPVMHIEKAN